MWNNRTCGSRGRCAKFLILKQPKDKGSIYETKINHGKSRVKSPGDLDFGFLASGETWALGERSAPVSSGMVVSWVGTGMLIVGSARTIGWKQQPFNIQVGSSGCIIIHDCAHSLLLRCFRWHCELALQGFRRSVEDNSTGILLQWMGCHCRRQSYSMLFFEYNTQNLGSEKKHL